MTRRALFIRVLIFVPLFAYFGYGAYQKWQLERAEARSEVDEAAARDVELKGATRSVILNDGRSIDIVELTPEQAERLHGIKVPPPDDRPAEVKPPTKAEMPAPDVGEARVLAPGAAGEVKAGDAEVPAAGEAGAGAKATN